MSRPTLTQLRIGRQRCTWGRCRAAAGNPTLDENGEVWALLCPEHQAKLDAAVASGDKRLIRGALAQAHGGAQAIPDWLP
jgi:hypothetical protein